MKLSNLSFLLHFILQRDLKSITWSWGAEVSVEYTLLVYTIPSLPTILESLHLLQAIRGVSGYRPGDTFLITICLSLRSVLPLSCQLNLFVATRQEEGKSRALPQLFCPVLSDRHPGLIAIKIVGSLRAAIIPVNYDLVSWPPVSSFFLGSGQFCQHKN